EINMTFALEERLIAQALMKAQKITSGAFKSSNIMQQRIARVQQRTFLIILFSIIGFIILSSCVSFLITRSITRPLNKLVKGAEIIGRGNLKHRVEIKTKNEIGELAAAFNRMTERRQLAEKRLEHLNALLCAIRSVNQLITREKDRKRLLQRACESLVESDVFYNAWIVMMDGSGKLVSTTEAGLGNDFPTMVQGLKGGEMADCIRQALSQPGVYTVDDPSSACTNCPLAKKYAGRGAMSLRLEHGGRVYGVIAVSILKDLLADDKAIGLFKEVGDDIAFALHGIEMEEAQSRTEEALRASEKRYRTLFEDSIAAIVITSREGKLLDVNQAALDLLGYTKVEITGMNFRELYVDPSNGERFQQQIDQKGSVANFEVKLRKKDGTELDSLFTVNTKRADDGSIVGYQGFIRDITGQKKLEAQFRQAQKMEAIGTLAGGVAHDFNNILTTIIGNAGLALMGVGKNDILREEIEEIKIAGERAASLTRQLLAFSRKQVIRPMILNFNELLKDVDKMLGRLIGEDVELLTIPGPELWQVEADPGQVEQVIINLVINAKDAMPKGGKLTVETANVDLDGNYFRKHGIKEKQPGTYVMLAVSDTGIGMDKETLEHIFEPFFTTKEIGKGTGLGLSTVYGIVKQNNGFIWAYSEPGHGTTFKIYLPKAKGDVASEKKEQHPVTEIDGSEIVLIVEDDDSLRKLAQKALQQHGYSVLEAENGEDALRVSEEHGGSIDLMITDVVMPKMSGKETAERLQPLYPQMKVIYMSGYTDDAIVHHGVLAPGLNFFEKPFTPEGLARKVREVLDRGIED
ncbi:MAG: PAS domain S-box protein, partial [Desulfobacteraceae bacterium]